MAAPKHHKPVSGADVNIRSVMHTKLRAGSLRIRERQPPASRKQMGTGLCGSLFPATAETHTDCVHVDANMPSI